MNSWSTELRKRQKAITEFREPAEPFYPATQKVVGVMSTDLKGLFTLWRLAEDATDEASKEVLKRLMGIDDQAIKEAVEAHARAIAEAANFESNFWTALRREHGLWTAPCVGVTQGFKVITMEVREEEEGGGFGLPHFMGKILLLRATAGPAPTCVGMMGRAKG